MNDKFYLVASMQDLKILLRYKNFISYKKMKNFYRKYFIQVKIYP